MASTTSYSDPKFGLVRRVIFPNVDAIGTAAVHPDEISFPTKTKIIKFGIITQDNDVRASSLTQLDLVSAAGAATLATFVFPSTITTIGTDVASGKTLTATTIAANAVVQGAVGVIGSAGNFQYYIDVQEQYEA